jgi:hypothetical protein
MRPILKVLVLIFSLLMTTGFSQEKTRIDLKEGGKLNKQKQIEAMVNAKEFVFVARIAIPSGMRSVNLSLNQNYIKFKPDLIDSNMPFFGSAYSGVGYGTDTGLHFKGEPEVFTINKNKKNFQIAVVVKGETDNFGLSLSVGFEGSAFLSITSNKRSTISYQGEISAIEN